VPVGLGHRLTCVVIALEPVRPCREAFGEIGGGGEPCELFEPLHAGVRRLDVALLKGSVLDDRLPAEATLKEPDKVIQLLWFGVTDVDDGIALIVLAIKQRHGGLGRIVNVGEVP